VRYKLKDDAIWACRSKYVTAL